VGFFFLPEASRERLSTLFSPTEDYNYTDEDGRVEIWTRGLGYLAEHPITGVGASNFPIAEATLGIGGNRVAHNSFLEVAAETGYPGFFLYVGAILLALWRLGRIRRKLARIRGAPEASRMMLCADALTMSLIAFCVNGFFLAQGYAPVLMSVVAMVGGLEIAAKRLPGLTPQRPGMFARRRRPLVGYQPGSVT
jgi:O-antigen ligase